MKLRVPPCATNDFGFATELRFLFQFPLWVSMMLLFRAKRRTVVCYESKGVPLNIFLVPKILSLDKNHHFVNFDNNATESLANVLVILLLLVEIN